MVLLITGHDNSNRSSYDSHSINDSTTYGENAIMYMPMNNRATYTSSGTKKKKKKSRKLKRNLKLKQSSPGVPPITCPYVDEAIRMIKELGEAYDQLRTTAIAEPLFDRRVELITETLEYIRAANETLRDNSLYWYNQFKK
jgi:hypothetical protein